MSPRSLFGSSNFRLALIYMALFGASVLVLLGFLYWSTAGYMARQTDIAIESEITGLAEQYRQRGIRGLIAVIKDRIARDPANASVYLLAGPTFEPLVGNIDQWPQAESGPDGWIEFRREERGPDGGGHTARAQRFQLEDGLFLLVGRDMRELEATRALIVRALAWGLGVTLLLGLGGAIIMSRSLLRRIEAINQTSREIMQGDLSRRVPTRGSDDDFDQLAAGLNAMLDRIQDLMQGVRQVSDNIAHDLRSPLARLRGQLEQAAKEGADREACQALIEKATAEADGLLSTFGALLRIAQIEAGRSDAAFVPVSLDDLLDDAVEFYAPLADEKNISLIRTGGGVVLPGDRDLLFQAIANLLDNAIKFSPPGGKINVALRCRDSGPEIVIADHGPGIPPDMRDKVFQRFFRLDQSRATSGNGLGLSLVGAVVKLHEATIHLEDNAPGLRAVITFSGIVNSNTSDGEGRKAHPKP